MAIMETISSEASTVSGPLLPFRSPPKRLLFDRRYGWVFDEWKDPSEEALAGGRGMFCVLPIAKSLLNVASQTMGLAAESVLRAAKSPNQFSPQDLHENICSQISEVVHNVHGWNHNLMNMGRKYPIDRGQKTEQSPVDPAH